MSIKPDWRRLGDLFWRTALFNLLVTLALTPFLQNRFLDLLISVEVVGFTIFALLWPALHHRGPLWVRAVLAALALLLGAFFGTVLVILVKGRDLAAVFYETERMWSFGITSTLGFIVGTLFTTVWAVRTRIARAEAELIRVEADRQRLARKNAEAELAVIRAQIEPHFLFNTLANLSFLIKDNPPQALAMLENLIDYLQAAVPRIRGETSTLRNELSMTSSYVSILQIRMGERLKASFDVPQDLLGLAFPPMMLITLVENSIKHGLNELQEGGSVHVAARRDGDTLCVTVADTGVGISPSGAQLRDGVGLSNIRERLSEMFGAKGELRLEANQPRGTLATLKVPL